MSRIRGTTRIACLLVGVLAWSGCATHSRPGSLQQVSVPAGLSSSQQPVRPGAEQLTRGDGIERETSAEGIRDPQAVSLAQRATAAESPDTISFDGQVQQASATEALPLEPVADFTLPAGAVEVGSVANPAGWQMSIDQILDFASENHPLLRVRQEEVDVARADVVEALLRENPQFVVDTDTPVNDPNPTQVSFRLTMPFYTGHKLDRRHAAAAAGVRRVSMEREVEEIGILLDTVDVASEVLYLRELLEVQADLQELAERRAEMIQSDFARDNSGFRISNKVDAELQAAELRTEQLTTQRELSVKKLELARTIGAPADMELDIAEPLTIQEDGLIPLDEVKQLAQERSPMFAAALAARRETDQLYRLARAEAIPDIDLGPRYQAELDAAGRDSIGVRFETLVPFFNRNQAEVARNVAQMRVDNANMQLAQFNAANEAVALYKELETLREDARALRETTSQLKERLDDFLENPTVKKIIAQDQILQLQQQLANQRLIDLRIRSRYFQVLNRLEVLIGQPVLYEMPVTDGEFNSAID